MSLFSAQAICEFNLTANTTQHVLDADLSADILSWAFSPFPLAAKMPERAETVSATLSTNRNCTIEITNVSGNYCLINPK